MESFIELLSTTEGIKYEQEYSNGFGALEFLSRFWISHIMLSISFFISFAFPFFFLNYFLYFNSILFVIYFCYRLGAFYICASDAKSAFSILFTFFFIIFKYDAFSFISSSFWLKILILYTDPESQYAACFIFFIFHSDASDVSLVPSDWKVFHHLLWSQIWMLCLLHFLHHLHLPIGCYLLPIPTTGWRFLH